MTGPTGGADIPRPTISVTSGDTVTTSTCADHTDPPGLGAESEWEWTWQMMRTHRRWRCGQCGQLRIWTPR